MASLKLSVVRAARWFWGLFSLCYYVALTIVCGIHKKWISFSFALAISVVLTVWLVLNNVAMITTGVLRHRRSTAGSRLMALASDRDLADAHPPQGSASFMVNPQPGTQSGLDLMQHINGDDDAHLESPRAFEVVDSEVDLSSIHDSFTTTTHTNPDSTSRTSPVSTTLEGQSGRGGANPLVVRVSGAARARRGLVVRAQQTALGGESPPSSVEETCFLSSPEANHDPSETQAHATAASAADALRFSASPPISKTATEKRVSSDSGSGGLDTHCANPTKSSPSAAAGPEACGAVAALQLAGHPDTAARNVVSLSLKSVQLAFMMPVVSIYVCIALTLLTLVATILFEYETHCLMLAFPALSLPGLWPTLAPLREFFDTYPSAARSFHVRVLNFVTHWVSLIVVAVACLAVYVVAFALEAATWLPYYPKREPVAKAIRVVSYLSPVPFFITSVIFFIDCALFQFGGTTRRVNSRPANSGSRGGAATANAAAWGNRGAQSIVGPPDGLAGTSAGRQTFLSTSAQPLVSQGLSVVTPRDSIVNQQEIESLESTLSSIVRSSMGSSIFIPPSSIASLPKMSICKNHVLDSRTNSNSSAGMHNAALPAHGSLLPQLKTVTMLYIAYRNIYDDCGDTVYGSFSLCPQQGGMAASRNMQQTISANYEALTEAIDDAQEQGSADANAYVLTAYEDALCLVWGLVPFSSEPVMLAIEKARQIMEAFHSRPKPPPTSTNEQQELVAAVVSAPHSLVGFIGSGGYRSVHFFNPQQHECGAQLLRRGLDMYRRLPSLQSTLSVPVNTFSGILMDGRARNNTAGSILARPCGIQMLPPSSTLGGVRAAATTATNGGGVRRQPIGMRTKVPVEQYPIMFEFLDHVQAKEEEWHLVVQRQERLGAKFCFLTEATQFLEQGDPKTAREVLTRAVENSDCSKDADSVSLAQMILEDLNRIASKPG